MKQIFEDPLPHFMTKWTRNVLKQLEDPKIQELKTRTLGQKKSVAQKITQNIEQKTLYNKVPLVYSDHGSCLVGEANMFSDDYNESDYDKRCDRCSTLSGQQAFIATASKTNLFSFKNNLYKHFEEDHPKLYKEWEAKR